MSIFRSTAKVSRERVWEEVEPIGAAKRVAVSENEMQSEYEGENGNDESERGAAPVENGSGQ